MPSIERNRKIWGEDWSKNGDEWSDQALFCNQPYAKWKQSIVETFINKNIDKNSTVLEIAPGRGRWTEYIVKKAKHIILVDISEKLIDYCKHRFLNFENIVYYVNDGKNFPFIRDDQIDFIWSYDSFVHMEKDVIESYFKEFNRILKLNGKAVIHHAARRHMALKFRFLRRYGEIGQNIYKKMSAKRAGSLRSDVSRKLIRDIARRNNLCVTAQLDSWGSRGEYNCKYKSDCISEIVRNQADFYRKV